MKNVIEYPMKLLLQNSGNIEFTSLHDLSKVIPENSSGKPLNYGQGEGQVEIDGTVWGFYVNGEGLYYMAFEEGELDWPSLNALVESISSAIENSFDVRIRINVVGPFNNRTDV